MIASTPTTRVQRFLADFGSAWSEVHDLVETDVMAGLNGWDRAVAVLDEDHFVSGAGCGAQGAYSRDRPDHAPGAERLVESAIDGDRATVRTRSKEGPEYTYELRQAAGDWRIARLARFGEEANAPLAGPGAAAIRLACDQIYGAEPAEHWSTVIPWVLGGPDPLEGVSAYDAGDHWHYVSYGLSELNQKASAGEMSGYGEELTFRLVKEGAETPPIWPVNLLQNLARYIHGTGEVFFAGDNLPLNGPIAADAETSLTVALFREDPELGRIQTPNGSVVFVQLVGITADELRLVHRWSSLGLLEVLAERDHPQNATRLSRGSYANDLEVLAAVERGADAEGSSTGVIFVQPMEWVAREDPPVLRVASYSTRDIAMPLPHRLRLGRDLTLEGPGVSIRLQRGDGPSISGTSPFVVTMTAENARRLASALEQPVDRIALDGVPFVVEVQPTTWNGPIERIH